MESVDLDLLIIALVKEHPVIWDKTLEEYKNRTATRNAWTEVFNQLNENYEELEAKEKIKYGKAVMRKWVNLRDCFQRSERQYKASMKSGSARQPKLYIYHEQLQFLKKTSQVRDTNDSFSNESFIDPQPDDLSRPSLSEDEETYYQVGPTCMQQAMEEGKSFRKPSNVVRKKRKPDLVELGLISALKEKPNRHDYFFKGIIPTLNTFDDDEVVEFQLNVMQLLSNMKNRKKAMFYNEK